MSTFETVTARFGDVPYMQEAAAATLRDVLLEAGATDLLEIGFYQGKSSAYMAAILEDRGGAGSLLTVDRTGARDHDPNIDTILDDLELSHRVTPLVAKRSYTWELQRLIADPDGPRFDFCYFDGGHTWDLTGFGVVLVDMLLRPGGLLLLDDMDWAIANSPYYTARPSITQKYDDDEVEAFPVRLVWDTVLPHLGYEQFREYPEHHWGLCRKPA